MFLELYYVKIMISNKDDQNAFRLLEEVKSTNKHASIQPLNYNCSKVQFNT